MFIVSMFVCVRLGQVITNILHKYHTNICIQTLVYELFCTYFFQTNFIPYEQLRTNFMHTNYFRTYFGPRITSTSSKIIFYIRSFERTKFCSRYYDNTVNPQFNGVMRREPCPLVSKVRCLVKGYNMAIRKKNLG